MNNRDDLRLQSATSTMSDYIVSDLLKMTDYTVSVMHFFLYIAHPRTIYLRLKFWFIYEALLNYSLNMGIAHIVLRPFLCRSNRYIPFVPYQHRVLYVCRRYIGSGMWTY